MRDQVFSLYRNALRHLSRVSDDTKTRSDLLKKVRQEFEEKRNIDRRNFTRIEYLIRKGNKQVEMLISDAVKSVSLR
jgi:succinate dehydrogenase assembly factor 1